jgi:hypothetical protein
MIYLRIMFLLHCLSREKNKYIKQFDLQRRMKIQEKHNFFSIRYINNIMWNTKE